MEKSCHRHRIYSTQLSRKNITFHKLSRDLEVLLYIKNGSIVIDLIICCGSICDIPHRSSVDKDVELFSGAPNRGHIPVTVEFESESEAITTKSKPWVEKADWDNWSLFLEQNSYTVPSNQADELWIFTKSLIAHASQYFIPSKTVSKHSKPFWNTKMEEASK